MPPWVTALNPSFRSYGKKEFAAKMPINPIKGAKFLQFYSEFKFHILIWTVALGKILRPYFSTNPTFENPLKIPTFYLVEAGF